MSAGRFDSKTPHIDVHKLTVEILLQTPFSTEHQQSIDIVLCIRRDFEDWRKAREDGMDKLCQTVMTAQGDIVTMLHDVGNDCNAMKHRAREAIKLATAPPSESRKWRKEEQQQPRCRQQQQQV